ALSRPSLSAHAGVYRNLVRSLTNRWPAQRAGHDAKSEGELQLWPPSKLLPLALHDLIELRSLRRGACTEEADIVADHHHGNADIHHGFRIIRCHVGCHGCENLSVLVD